MILHTGRYYYTYLTKLFHVFKSRNFNLGFSLPRTMFEYTPVSDKVKEKQRCRVFPNYVRVLYRDPDPPLLRDLKPEPALVTEHYKNFDMAIKNFSIRKDDIWIMSYPKTGTTLLSELITVLLSGMDFEKLEKTSLNVRSPYLE